MGIYCHVPARRGLQQTSLAATRQKKQTVHLIHLFFTQGEPGTSQYCRLPPYRRAKNKPRMYQASALWQVRDSTCIWDCMSHVCDGVMTYHIKVLNNECTSLYSKLYIVLHAKWLMNVLLVCLPISCRMITAWCMLLLPCMILLQALYYCRGPGNLACVLNFKGCPENPYVKR